MKCDLCDNNFEVRNEDLTFYNKFDVPAPTECPDCRLRNRLIFRNERNLFKKDNIISIYDEESPYKILSAKDWWLDNWDPLSYGKDFDFSKTFFEQFQEIRLQIPRIALFNINPDNSDYCQQAYDNKDSYLCFVIKDSRDCYYVTHSNRVTDCIDCSHIQNCELCYECLDSDKLYNCFYSESCQNSNDLYFCSDCIGCHFCVGSHGLRNKSYYIFNKPYEKEEFFTKFKALNLGTYASFSKLYNQFYINKLKFPVRANLNLNVENSYGNYLINCKNSFNCFDSFQTEDCGYNTWTFESRDCFDIYGMGTSELVYYSLGVEKLYNSAFCTFVSHSNNVFYSDLCFYSSDIFGCIGLKKNKYCILNKEYTQNEYEILKSKIIEHMKKTGEWGKFFPKELSPFAYNTSIAQEYFPLEDSLAKNQGFKWKEIDIRAYSKSSYKMADKIEDENINICSATLSCIECNKNYKIMNKELSFSKNNNISLTRKCTDCRYKDRLKRRSNRKLINKKCFNCLCNISTSLNNKDIEKIYCEKCYSDLVV